ncbi:MAG: TIM44-like domain-containing protein [Aromatoleum sp.]|jgi:predicted lipid-binding transport protein (Tim44 family)|uniref:Tim44 domain-containing protein n=1 Tax=Aromatoleum sp. TaxID=2307007 RepID=UPI0028942A8D|nr:TIM44-like domain-containing protein [Aromatoleum sp.]MDT3672656.1 TIM44-like domain-containing protein [Aromatoleum sp.]
MKNLLLGLIAIVFTFGLGIHDADAKRLGGGGSFGMQRQMTPQQAPRQPSAAPQRTPQGANATPQKRSWMGPIAGLAAGLGLAALFSHLGLGEEMGSFVLIALLVFGALMLFRMLSRRGASPQAAQRMEYAGAPGPRESPAPSPALAAAAGAGATPGGPAIPADFDAEAFVRQAKVQFIRLQAANDAGDLNDIREFTSPEMFAEIRMQLSDRGAAAQRTDVVELNAEVIEVAEEPQRYVVSVRFNGLLREDEGAAPAPFDEVWHLTKPKAGTGGWVVAGIQQVS